MSGYRGDMGAALARVAQLEEEVAYLRRQLQQTPAMQARLAELRRRRSAALESLRLVERSTRRALSIGSYRGSGPSAIRRAIPGGCLTDGASR